MSMAGTGTGSGGTTRVRLGLAQCNPTVGAIDANAVLIRQAVLRLAGLGADLVLLPEMALTGYPVEDLALRHSFQDASRTALAQLAQDLGADLTAAGRPDVIVVVGYLDRIEHGDKPAPANAVAVIQHGRIAGRYVKHHLPNYGVFDEARHFAPGTTPLHLRIGGTTATLAICEDLWQEGGPVAWARDAQSRLLLVVNASPYEQDKDDVRLALCEQRVAQSGCALAYVNLVGAQDELVFDGDSMVLTADGTLLTRAAQFADDDIVVTLDLPDSPAPTADAITVDLPQQVDDADLLPLTPRLDAHAEVYAALVTGVRDYVEKNGFASVMLGLSGGIDSALVAAIAADAIGAHRVFGVSMPSEHSSQHSRDDAADLAARTGLHYRTVAIAPMVDAFQASLTVTGLAAENLQARVRGVILMSLSNAEGHLVLTTGNKSELSVGYSTLYGDSVGGFAPIKDVPKTLVWELARWRNAQAAGAGQAEPIPVNSIEKPPSAELRPGQLDTDSLPEYDALDAVLHAYVGEDRGAHELLAAGFDPELVDRVLRLTDAAEYKRRQYPPGPKISSRAFGRDRRLPITNAWRDRA